MLGLDSTTRKMRHIPYLPAQFEVPKSKVRAWWQSKRFLCSNVCRSKSHGNAGERPDPAVKWKSNRTLLIFWLSAAIVTLISSLYWLQVGMWAGVVGIIGPSLSLCGCCSSRRLPLNLHVRVLNTLDPRSIHSDSSQLSLNDSHCSSASGAS